MSSCNYCNWKMMKKRAKEQGRNLVLSSNGNFGLGGISVYEIPQGKDKDIILGNEKLREKHFKAWFMELPDRCEC